ncbi:hypothetical protein ACF0H5_023595 [Mactra antiquata]
MAPMMQYMEGTVFPLFLFYVEEVLIVCYSKYKYNLITPLEGIGGFKQLSHASVAFFQATLLSKTSLKLHDILSLLRKHVTKGQLFLGCNKFCSASEVLNFYVPNFSDSKHHKDTEEMIVFNFGKFLKKVEREGISTNWVNVEDGEYSERTVTVNMGHVLQAFIGCGALPKNITAGAIDFCLTSDQFSYVNTCAPSFASVEPKTLSTMKILKTILFVLLLKLRALV